MRGGERRRTQCGTEKGGAPHPSPPATPFAPRKETSDFLHREVE
jgi:hypothetical protein